jgi:hypothetical protein
MNTFLLGWVNESTHSELSIYFTCVSTYKKFAWLKLQLYLHKKFQIEAGIIPATFTAIYSVDFVRRRAILFERVSVISGVFTDSLLSYYLGHIARFQLFWFARAVEFRRFKNNINLKWI